MKPTFLYTSLEAKEWQWTEEMSKAWNSQTPPWPSVVKKHKNVITNSQLSTQEEWQQQKSKTSQTTRSAIKMSNNIQQIDSASSCKTITKEKKNADPKQQREYTSQRHYKQ